MPPLSQGLGLNSQTLSALSLILAMPKLVASAGSEFYQDSMLVANLLQAGVVNVKSRRGFLKLCSCACTKCRSNAQRVVCQCVSGEDPDFSRLKMSKQAEKRKCEGINGRGQMRRRTFGASIVGGTVALPSLMDLQGGFLGQPYQYLCDCPLDPTWLAARALGDPTVSIDEVTPPVAPAGSLPVAEERTVELFERNTYSVVNIFDVTLRPQVNMTGSVEVPEGNGSGFIWDEQGHIVTNYHVIGSSLARNPPLGQVVARVTLLGADGFQKNFEAKLVGADKTKDLAVLDVDAPVELLRPVNLGQSSKLRVGQRCLAIGNPFGFDHTLTVGVVSGLNRDIYSQTGVVIGGGIQTDAAINPGNSGGPLLDSKGNVIGVNTAIFTRTGTSAGVGFAIPVDTVAKLVPQLIAYGKVMRPGLNVQFAPEVVAKQLNVRSGALVLTVPDRSAAAKAGLNATRRGLTGNIILGDIIVGVGDSTIKNPQELAKALDSYQVGDQILLKVQRNNSIEDLPFTLEENTR